MSALQVPRIAASNPVPASQSEPMGCNGEFHRWVVGFRKANPHLVRMLDEGVLARFRESATAIKTAAVIAVAIGWTRIADEFDAQIFEKPDGTLFVNVLTVIARGDLSYGQRPRGLDSYFVQVMVGVVMGIYERQNQSPSIRRLHLQASAVSNPVISRILKEMTFDERVSGNYVEYISSADLPRLSRDDARGA